MYLFYFVSANCKVENRKSERLTMSRISLKIEADDAIDSKVATEFLIPETDSTDAEADADGMLNNIRTGEFFQYKEVEDSGLEANNGGGRDEAILETQEVPTENIEEVPLNDNDSTGLHEVEEKSEEEENEMSSTVCSMKDATETEEMERSESSPELVDLENGEDEVMIIPRIDSYETQVTETANIADIEHDHIFARTPKTHLRYQNMNKSSLTSYHPQLLPKPTSVGPVGVLLPPVNPNSMPLNFIIRTPDGQVFQLPSIDMTQIQEPNQLINNIIMEDAQNIQTDCEPEESLPPPASDVVMDPVPVPLNSSSELGLGQTITLDENEVNVSELETQGIEVHMDSQESDSLASMGIGTLGTTLPTTSSSKKDLRRPTANSEVMKSSMLNITVPGGGTLQMQRYIYTQALCRVCLFAKENMISLFEDVNVTERGLIENSRGPNTCNRFNILPALKLILDIDVSVALYFLVFGDESETFLDFRSILLSLIIFYVQVSYGDALPDHICVDCLDSLMLFSEFRKRVNMGQSKLSEILAQVLKKD